MKTGDSFVNVYPFVKGKFESFDENGPFQKDTWNPGTTYEYVYPDESAAIADGEGMQVLNVIDVHKPGRFPTRVFYTMEWVDPDGNRFGKSRLRICTLEKFQRLLAGYRFHYEVASKPQ